MGKRVRTSGYRTRLSDLRSLHLPALCTVFALGAVVGHVLVQFVGMDSELASRLYSYTVSDAESLPSASFLSVAALYFRFPLLVLLFGCCSFGAIAIPLVLSVQGFTLSFAAASLAAALGRQGVVLALAAFGLRGLLSVGCTLLLALVMTDKGAGRSDDDKKQRGKIIALCFFLLSLGVILELTIVPMLFSSALKLLR